SAEERLAKQKVDDGTRQVQRDILKDMDALIKASRQQQNDNSANSSSSADPSDPKNRSGRRTAQASRKNSGSQGQQGQRKGQGERNDKSSENGGKSPHAGGGKFDQNDDLNRIPDVFKDAWGHLPSSMRAEMNAYSHDAFMAKYKDLLERYYATIAEKSG